MASAAVAPAAATAATAAGSGGSATAAAGGSLTSGVAPEAAGDGVPVAMVLARELMSPHEAWNRLLDDALYLAMRPIDIQEALQVLGLHAVVDTQQEVETLELRRRGNLIRELFKTLGSIGMKDAARQLVELVSRCDRTKAGYADMDAEDAIGVHRSLSAWLHNAHVAPEKQKKLLNAMWRLRR